MVLMKAGLVILFMCGVIACRGQTGKSIDKLFRQLNKGSIDFKKVEKKFTPIYYEGLSTDTTVFKLEGHNIVYYKCDNNKEAIDLIKIDNVEHSLFIEKNGNRIPLDLDILNASLFECTAFKKNYFCIISGGTGLYKSGTFQEIKFFVLIDITDKNNIVFYELFSRASSIHSIGDFNKDGVLDFLYVENDSLKSKTYLVTLYTIQGKQFIPIFKKSKNYFMVLKQDTKGYYTISK